MSKRYFITQRFIGGLEVTLRFHKSYDGTIKKYLKQALSNRDQPGIIKVTQERKIKGVYRITKSWSYNNIVSRTTD